MDDIIAAHVTGWNGQEAGRLDIANMRDKQEAIAIIDTLGRAILSIRVLESCSLEGDSFPLL